MVRKDLKTNIPKQIFVHLIRKTLEEIRTKLQNKVLQSENVEEYIAEDPAVAVKRNNANLNIRQLKLALDIITQLNE